MGSGPCLLWKMRNERTYRNLYTELPMPLVHIRGLLKELLHIDKVPTLDLVAYKRDDVRHEDVALSDYCVVEANTELLVSRMSKEDAQVVIDNANAAALREPININASNSVSSAPLSTCSASESSAALTPKSVTASFSHISENIHQTINDTHNDASNADCGKTISPSTSSRLILSSKDDEDARIQAVMDQHAHHRGPSGFAKGGTSGETLTHRYLRNKNWTWNKDEGETLPQGYNPVKRTQLTRNLGVGGMYNRTGSGNRSNVASNPIIPVPPEYICHMCGLRGHHIKNCVKSHDSRHNKRVKPATGIPANFLQRISPDDITKYNDVYVLRDGNFAIMKSIGAVSGGAYFSKTLEQKIEHRLGSTVSSSASNYVSTSGGPANMQQPSSHLHANTAYSSPPTASATSLFHNDLKCPVCARLFDAPVLTVCCGETFCRACIVIGKSCPICNTHIHSQDQLETNTAIQDSIDAIIGKH